MASRGAHPSDGGPEGRDSGSHGAIVAVRRDGRRLALPLLLVLGAVGVVAGLGAIRGGGLDATGVDADESVAAASGGTPSTAQRDPALFVPIPPGEGRPPNVIPRLGPTEDVTAAAGAATSTTPSPDDTTAPTPPPQDEESPSVVARPVPAAVPDEPPPSSPPPPWAGTTFTTTAGHVSTAAGCVPYGSSHPGAAELDAFFAARAGPVIGWDYQHVYPLGGDRYLWLFQDAFVDHSGGAVTLGQSAFAHNVALIQEGGCFRLLHRGSTTRPEPFETGTGSRTLSTWFWPMGGELHDGRLQVFWVQMVKDAFDPSPPNGLGWHPAETWVATYDPVTLTRTDFRRAANPGVAPVYGYAVASDATHTYLFGNTFEQNLAREGGYWSGRHSATRMYLARVPRGRLADAPEYRTGNGWTRDAVAAVPVLDRHWAEFPFQPRFVDGQWVGVAAVNGYWGDEFSVDVARKPWGPWTTVESRPVWPRAGDPAMNTYHAHLVPWRDTSGHLVVTMSNNARDMRRDAWPHPYRYRPMVFTAPWVVAPSPPPPTTAPVTTPTIAPTAPNTTTTVDPTTTTATTAPAAPAITSTVPDPTSTTVAPTTSPGVSPSTTVSAITETTAAATAVTIAATNGGTTG